MPGKMKRRPDSYSKRAKKEGYRSRAAYKLMQLQKRFKILHKGQVIVDLCGAPGGWSQIASSEAGDAGKVILVDLEPVFDLDNITCLRADITSPSIVQQIQARLDAFKRVDVVLADCSPKVIGQWDTDHARQIWLSQNALHIAVQLQAKIFACKLFQGDLLQEFLVEVKQHYPRTNFHKPRASRKQSAEIYLLARK
ncbi:MAG: SAM-dependent methyltransferase [Candidatus Thorarchaeota archaeon]